MNATASTSNSQTGELKTLQEIAQKLADSDKKVQLIYAFNGTGKTRLSREFTEFINQSIKEGEGIEEDEEEGGRKIIYYNAFTEDLFYWDNLLDIENDRKLHIRPNIFTKWVLKDLGQDSKIIKNFQHYTSDKLLPRFNMEYKKKNEKKEDVTVPAFSEVSFSILSSNNGTVENIKISKGEESCFIWCMFFSLLEDIIATLNISEDEHRATKAYNKLKYIFIDDPVSSLDENHLIELAVNIAELIKTSKSELKFIITTHNPLFYNVLYNELSLKGGLYFIKEGGWNIQTGRKERRF